MTEAKRESCAKCGQPLSENEKEINNRQITGNNARNSDKPLCDSCQKKQGEQAKKKKLANSNFGALKVYCPKCKILFDSEKEMLKHYDEEHLEIRKTAEQKTSIQTVKIQEEKTHQATDIKQVYAKALLTKNILSYMSLSTLLITLGLFLRNPPIIYISLAPLFFIVVGAILKQPKTITITRREIKSSCYTGEVIEIASDIVINQGYGFLVVRDFIPEHFEIAEGTNFKVIWKGSKPKNETLIFKVRCTKRGLYSFGKMDWEFRHVLGLRQTLIGQAIQEKQLLVQLKTIPIRRIRNTKTLSKLPLPLGALNKSGISTTDFKEIREYSSGDPFKSINWKITSRMSSQGYIKPFINEFEKEGKKFVWVFIDGSHSMGSHGTVISNAFENAINAANDLSQYYLERDCFVGVYMYNKKHQLIYPDIGRRQRFKISKGLLTMEMDYDEPLRESVQRCRSYLIGNAPLNIIITALSEAKVEDLLEGIKELRKYNKSYVKSSVLIINVKSYAFAASDEQRQLSAKILQCRDYPIVRKLREAGTMVVDWNPVEQPLTHVLLSEVKRR
jgi:uncharacterized protein (DUF58 family)